MKKWISILGGLLAVQLVLVAAVTLTGEEYGAFRAEEKMLAFDRQAVDGLRIEEGKEGLTLKKRNGKWLLPESDDFPADGKSVERLLDKLAAMKKGWPVATTGGALRRFKVSDKGFERKLTLLAGDKAAAVLYVGSSPGYRKVHVRPADDKSVYAVAFNVWEAGAKSDDWIDKTLLKLDGKAVERIELPGVTLQRKEDKLRVTGLGEKEQTNGKAVRSLLDKLTGLRIQSLLGVESKPEYRQEKPELEVKLERKGGDLLTYRFSKPKEGGYYVLKRSDLKYYLKVAEYAVNPIKESTRKKLTQSTKAEEASTDDSGEVKKAADE